MFIPTSITPPLMIATRAVRDKRTDITTLMRALANEEGHFLLDSSTNQPFFFRRRTGQVMAIAEENSDFIRYLGGLNVPIEKVLVDRIWTYAAAHGNPVDIHRISWANTDSMTIYVHSQGSAVYRIKASGIDTIINGDDGVYFLAEPGSSPFSLVNVLPTNCDLLHQLVLQPFSFATDSMSADQGEFLVITWFISLLLSGMLPVSPVLALIGPANSGKTVLLRLFSELLFGSQMPVQRAPADKNTLDGILGRRSLLCLDNLTVWSDWLDQRLESISRREIVNVKRGQKYCELHLDCSLAITTRQLPDASLQSINRILPVFLNRPEHMLTERAMVTGVRQNRDVIMTQILERLQRLLISMGSSSPGYEGPYAAADFADMAVRVARAFGFDQQAADALERLASLHDTVLPSDQHSELIRLWIGIGDNEGRKVKATELHRELDELAKDNQISFGMPERSFAHWLSSSLNRLRQLFSIEQVTARSRQMFYVIRQKPNVSGLVTGGDI